MNVVEAQRYLVDGLVAAGLKRSQIRAGMDLARPNNSDSVPSASVFPLESRFTRQATKVRIDAGELKPPVADAVGGVRHTLMGGLTWFEVTVQQRSLDAMQNTLVAFLEYVVETPLVDRAGNSYRLLSEGVDKEKVLAVRWNDQDEQDRVTATFELPVPGALWRDHPRIPIDIVVQYELDGGQDA